MDGRDQVDSRNGESSVTFFTLACSDLEDWHARFLIRSLRAFGGSYQSCPVLIFTTRKELPATRAHDLAGVKYIPLEVDHALQGVYFTRKVSACAEAERMCSPGVRSLVWMGSRSLVLSTPHHFDLQTDADVALRPVHHRNVGALFAQPLDPFWRGIYDCVGLQQPPYRVETFVDALPIAPYFNTHLFAFNPSLSLMQAWLEHFQKLALDRDYQAGPCADEQHQIFLHQAVLSTLIASHLEEDRLRFLPPTYSYPLHMHAEVPEADRPESLNDLICPVYEGVFNYPLSLGGLEAQEPLHSWLKSQGAAPV